MAIVIEICQKELHNAKNEPKISNVKTFKRSTNLKIQKIQS